MTGDMTRIVNIRSWDEYRDWRVRETVTIPVTPELAEQMLERNVNNRPYRPYRTKQFVDLMRSGKFVNTGQGLIFYQDGSLADGQHRLHAIKQTRLPQYIDVTFGAPFEARDALDLPLRRTRGDVLYQQGEKDYNLLAATLKLSKRYLDEQQGASGRVGTDQHEMLTLLDRFPQVRDYLTLGRAVYRQVTGLTPAASTTAAFLTGEAPDPDGPWFKPLLTGVDRYRGDPRTALERQLAKSKSRDSMRMVALYGRAYAAWSERRALHQIVWRKGVEKLPVFGQVTDLRDRLQNEEGN